MKKTLIALAALAVTGAAFAQSTVTLSGKANIGLIKETGNDLKAAGGADGSASRLIFRGTEDLGGGLKANFHMEQGVDLGTGATDAVTFQRQAWMGLSGGFGELRAGRQYTLGFMSSIGYMPSTYANAQISAGASFNGAGSRNDAQIRYTTPSFNGLVVEAATQLKGNTATALSEFVVRYGSGPVKAALYTSKTKGTSGSNMAINGSYDLGGVLLAGGFIDRAGSNTGKIVFVHAGTTMGAFSPYVQFASNSDNDQNAIELGGRYSLSKRTAGYVHVVNNSDLALKTKLAIGLDHNF
jgi:predicted porin